MEKGVTEITDSVFSEKKEEEEEEEEEEESVGAKQIGEEEKNSGGISIINTLISNLVAPMSPKLRSGDEREEGAAAGDDEREAAAAGDRGGGLLDNLVSHLPAPLPDDAAPATDEASILLHSLVHD